MNLKEFAKRWNTLQLGNSAESEKLALLHEFLSHELDKTYMTLNGKAITLREMFDYDEWKPLLFHIGDNLAKLAEEVKI